jgi:ATPase (fragment)
MDSAKVQNDISTIKKMKENGVFKNYIEYIKFPFYKNLIPKSEINFKFPLTVLVGKNGSGKSSTLHALFGAPRGYTCSNFWFSTEVDPIAEDGDRPRYFYGYKNDMDSGIKEVLKARILRGGTKTKKRDPDYWETSKPLKKDGMNGERCAPVEKNVIYLDFRAEVSAFDKTLHFSKGNIDERKSIVRDRAKYLNRLFNDEPVRFPGQYSKNIGKMEILDKNTVDLICKILNKEYTEIRVAEHKIYKNDGISVLLKTNNNGQYSEANAGSGEVAVVQLVRQIEKAEEYSLILLDEPEVSLHPGAQENMKEYLISVVKRKKLQIVISTHSSNIISGLPNSAIKLFKTNENGKFYIQEDVNYQEAFFSIEDKIDNKKIIYCEDDFAKKIIEKTLNNMGKEKYFNVMYQHGGEKTLIKRHLIAIASNNEISKNTYFILDGDMDFGYEFNEDKIPRDDDEIIKFLKESVKNAFGLELDASPDGSKGGVRKDQIIQSYLCYLRFFKTNVRFLPNKKIPEEIVLNSSYAKKHYKDILDNYNKVNSKNAKKIILEITKNEHGNSDYYCETADKLAYKWSLENTDDKNYLEKVLEEIFNA